MVVCKYFQQGTCRYGQYCRFQHINSFGGNQGNTNKQFTEGSKNIVLGVAEEVLAAERGGQWLLSCFGPLKEQPCIPGMDDVSPEEVRWEMYQAQKNGTVDQTKLQFQQLCQAMTAKREALKNPTHETAAMLDKLQKSNRDSTFGGKTNFALSTPQMSQPSNTATSSSVFGAKTFGAASNPFGGGFAASGAATSSIFGRAATTSASVFGAKPSFGGNAMFGSGQPNANTVFGGAAMKGAATVFGGGNQNMQSFAAATSAPGSVFGGGGGGSFGTTQASSPFSMAQPAQSTTSVFGTTTTAAPTNSIFGGSSSTLFGAAAPATNLFGTAASAQTANPFGAQPAAPASSTIGSTSIFGAPKNTAAFGGAPVFGAAGGFGAAPGASVFGAQATFDNSQMPAGSVFGGTSAQSTTFGANAQTTNSFGALATPQAATSSPFGAVVSAANATPFGAPAGPFGSPAANSPFARAAPFTGAMQPGNEEASPFAAAAAGGFGALAPPVSQPFGAPAFGTAPSTPFASTTSTTTTSNPFAPRSQQQVNTPFGVAQTTMSSAGPFGSPFGSTTTASIVDEAFYTIEGKLTDDEKSSYMADKFAFGKIPLDPPTIELR